MNELRRMSSPINAAANVCAADIATIPMSDTSLPSIQVDYAPPNAEVLSRWKRTERRLTVVSLPKIMLERRKRKEEEDQKRRKRQEFVDFVDSLPTITAHIDSNTENHFFPPPDIPIDQEANEFIRFASIHKEYEMGKQYYYGLETMLNFRMGIRDRLQKRKADLEEATAPLEALFEPGEKVTYRTFHSYFKDTMRQFAEMNFEICEKAFKRKTEKKEPKSRLSAADLVDLRKAISMHRSGIARMDELINDLKNRSNIDEK
ncbi:hypothetical protein QR680_003351 [Steinernema hermaphroditum]|uniref:Uncharacterized protein n=1 Tax=Steinernema hermaphroditum TaxID=289476 RepID=A0AA39H6D9_9BILA|nr:hypothetical protein QR680_003351 [Steinernema hermaphroditum]